jgi:ribosomal protein L21
VERTTPGLGKGDELVFERVMLLSRDGEVKVGAPTVDGAVVRARVLMPTRGKKVIVFKKKRRKGYKLTKGHRQNYYRVQVGAIEG